MIVCEALKLTVDKGVSHGAEGKIDLSVAPHNSKYFYQISCIFSFLLMPKGKHYLDFLYKGFTFSKDIFPLI